jgi:hypothetical protein
LERVSLVKLGMSSYMIILALTTLARRSDFTMSSQRCPSAQRHFHLLPVAMFLLPSPH